MLPVMRRRRSRGALWMAAYVACCVLVLSFICFEVLDLDGSDFANPARVATTIKLTEPPQDIRRVPMSMPIAAESVLLAASRHSERLQVQHRVEAAGAETPADVSLRHDSRSTLARGLLPDPSRSA
jgi:hypothetical protein